MTHLSRFRYGEKMHEPPSASRGCGEVRVSYFDPASGKPCKEKPKPLKVQREEMESAKERAAKRMREEAEAAEIMRNMKARKKKANNSLGRAGRPVLVDGVLFQTVASAAHEIGVDPRYLSKQLRASRPLVKGRKVEYLKVDA